MGHPSKCGLCRDKVADRVYDLQSIQHEVRRTRRQEGIEIKLCSTALKEPLLAGKFPQHCHLAYTSI